jgi:L-ascorbate metabolism protein UlaG (beta-lactamase superfamily)
MGKIVISLCFLVLGLAGFTAARQKFEKDVVPTAKGDLEITFLGHGSLMMTFGGKTIHIDPYGEVADYASLPKADLVLVTHEHFDHLDPKAQTVLGLPVEAVPAYNIAHKRPDGNPFHPKGSGNGYIVTFGDKRVYIAGDTENTPEMKELKMIDVAFLPMNLPYTMTPEMVADAARAFRPKILYPYHFGETDTSQLVTLLQGEKGIEVRIRRMR